MAQILGHSRRHDVLVSALARGESHTAAAKLAGVSRRTVQRKLSDPQFRE
jgi:transposase